MLRLGQLAIALLLNYLAKLVGQQKAPGDSHQGLLKLI
jgi:hypothetical protein